MFKKGGMTYQYPRRMGDCMDFRCAFAAAVNYVCTAVNFSFARMRKKYIEDNDELDAEKVEKVAPYYQKTSVVLAGTQIGYLFCSSIFCPFFIPECSSHGFVLGRNQFFFRGAGICRCFCLHCYCTDALLDFYHSCAGIHIIGQAAVHVILLYMVHQFVRQAMEAFHFHRLVRGKKDIGYERNPVQRRS